MNNTIEPPQWVLDSFNNSKDKDPSILSLEKNRFGEGWSFTYHTNGDLHTGWIKNNPPRLEKYMSINLPSC